MKKIFNLGVFGAVLALLALPAVSSAATYLYANLNGSLVQIEAANVSDALAQAAVGNIHSGVMLASNLLNASASPAPAAAATYKYTYADVNGNLKSVTATSLEAASMMATDKAIGSGFIVSKMAQ